MRNFVILILVMLLVGCATQLTQAGRTVRQIQPDWATKCEFLGVLDASESRGLMVLVVPDVPVTRRGALNKIRDQVAEIGGNAFVVSEKSSTGFRTLIQVDAYKCP